MQLRPVKRMSLILSAFSLAQVRLVLHCSWNHISIARVVGAQRYLAFHLNVNLVDGRIYLMNVGLAVVIV